MPHSLYGKLVAVFFALICATSLSYVILTLVVTRAYQQEVQQKLNRELAQHIVAETPLLDRGKVNQEGLNHLFHTLMVVNPSIELYLIDPAGTILAYNAPPGKVKRTTISLEPVDRFLGGVAALPIRGDDPRDRRRTKVFSAAPVYQQGKLAGYLYVVLGGENYDSVQQMIQESYILRVLLGIATVSLVVSLAIGVLSFNWLTRRLRRLSAGVDVFKQGDFLGPMSLPSWRRDVHGDEIDRLGVTVEQMSHRIVDQIRQLRSADASRREMIANISHDLRTPLTSMQGYLETLVMKEGELSQAERGHYLELALKHGQRLSQLIAELFELAMLESQGTTPDFEPFSLAELVQDVAQKFKLDAQKKGLHLNTEIPEGAPFVSGDIALIERVFENLIENAIKYTAAGGSIELSVMVEPGIIRARVSDTGLGISEKELPRIFERFYRVEKSRGDVPDGTGLGLAIVQRILQLHNSRISVHSEPGAGTSFTFDLPVAA